MDAAQHSPSPRFWRGLQANLDYWQKQTAVFNPAHLQQLEPDFPNLFQAVEMAMVLPDLRVQTAVLVQSCFFWIENTGYVTQWLALLARLIAALPESEVRLRFALQKQQGQFQRLLHQYEAAEATFAHCFALVAQLQDPEAEADLLLNQCQAMIQQRKFDQAEEIGLAALQNLDGRNGRLHALTLQALGNIALEQGELAVAEARLNTALSLPQPWQMLTDETRTMTLLAFTKMKQNKGDDALKTLQLVAEKLAGTPFFRDQIEVQINLGTGLFGQGKHSEAAEAFQHGLTLLDTHDGFVHFRALLNYNLGYLLRHTHKALSALVHFQRSVPLWQQLNNSRMLLKTYNEMAEAYFQLDQISNAVFMNQQLLHLASLEPAAEPIKQLQAKAQERLQAWQSQEGDNAPGVATFG